MPVHRPFVVAVDGPAGSGKTSLCGFAAAKLGWSYLSTGFIYRAFGMLMHERKITSGESGAVEPILDELCSHLEWRPANSQVLFHSKDIGVAISSHEAGNLASQFAKLPIVRQKLLPLQRKMILSAPVGVIVDGRDIGTVVFPDADLKIFMTASIEERAQRRVRQLKLTSEDSLRELAQIKSDLMSRDRQDAQRGEAPLRKAHDAIEFDNSFDSIDQAVIELTKLITNKLQIPGH